MELTISVSGEHRYGRVSTSIRLSEPFTEVFEPIKTTDIPFMALATGEDISGSKSFFSKKQMREDFAKELSNAITEKLLEIMRERDTHNGYCK